MPADSLEDKKAHVRAATQDRDHVCHATGCGVQVKPAYLMCPRHWRMVPRSIQKMVWATYSPGQEQGKASVTRAYLEAMKAAINAVEAKEGRAFS